MMNNCVVCDSSALKFFLEKDNYSIYKCESCGLISTDNIPRDLCEHYSSGYFNGDLALDGYMDYEEEKKACYSTYDKYLKLIESYVKVEKNMLEIGCATGYFLELAKARGWNVGGLDISEYAVVEAKKKGLSVAVGTPAQLDINGPKQSLVVMLDVFEHLSDLRGDMKMVYDILDNDGLLAISTPNSGSLWAKLWSKRWHAIVPPQHLNLFSKTNLTSFLEKNNFEVLAVNYHGKRFTVPYIFRLLYTWTRWEIWMRLASSFSRVRFLQSFSVPINLGDTMFVIARKI